MSGKGGGGSGPGGGGGGSSRAIVDNTARRTWDKAEYAERAEQKEREADEAALAGSSKGGKAAAADEALAARKRKRQERDPLHQGLIVARSSLTARDHDLNLTERLNKTQVVGLNTPLSQQGGYYCSVCDCLLRDSQTYLDHINGKYHNRALGMSMRVERSTVEQVKGRLQELKEKQAAARPDDHLPDGIDRRLAEREAAEERARQEKRERKREAKQQQQQIMGGGGGGGKGEGGDEEDEDADAQMMALMGFGGFGGSKKG